MLPQRTSNSSIALQFKHQLSSIVLNVKAGVGFTAADLAGMVVTITSMPLYADFDLGTGALSNLGGTISTLTPKAISTASGYVASLEAIVIPQSAGTFAGRTMNFTVNGSLYRYPIAASVAFDVTKKYIYNITIDRTAINVTTTITDWTGTGSTTNMGAST